MGDAPSGVIPCPWCHGSGIRFTHDDSTDRRVFCVYCVYCGRPDVRIVGGVPRCEDGESCQGGGDG